MMVWDVGCVVMWDVMCVEGVVDVMCVVDVWMWDVWDDGWCDGGCEGEYYGVI